MATHPGPVRKGRNFTAGACRCTRPPAPARLHTYGDASCADAQQTTNSNGGKR